MNVNNVALEAVGTKMHQFPTTGLPEIVFAGKSNVGKSSLINSLINRKALARTSGQPGKTRTINFYNVENQTYFVDLPGYGYAKASKDSKEQWAKMIEDYLYQRKTIKLVVLLIDIRHDPSENDIMMADWIKEMGYTPMIIATKADKINRSQLSKHLSVIRKQIGISMATPVIPFSSETKQGKTEVWEVFDGILQSYQDEIVSDSLENEEE